MSRLESPKDLLIGRRWRIVLESERDCPTAPGLTTLVIPRGAFGSGEHETTASCLEELERIPSVKAATVLDVGCGTGVLGIAALKLGAESVVGVDISTRAVTTTRRAARLNDLEDRIHVVLGPLDAVGPWAFDLILANLHGDLLLDLAESIVAAAAPAAPIVLSGIAWEYAFPVREEFTRLGCGVAREFWLEEFVTLSLTAP